MGAEETTENKRSEGERLIRLALFVKEHPQTSFHEIRRSLPEFYGFLENENSPKTKTHDDTVRKRFERDKKNLENCGIHLIYDDKNNFYSLDLEQSYAAPVELTEAQASVVRILCNALLEDDDYPFKNSLRMILSKIGDDIDVPDLLPSMERSQPGRDRKAPSGFSKVQKAIDTRTRLSFTYTDSKGRASTREVEPFGCFFHNRHFYIVTYDPQARDERVFRLDRCSNLKGTSTSFEKRAFNAEDYCAPSFQFGPERFTARIHLDQDCSWRAPHLMMGKGNLEELEDGSAIWTVEARSYEALASWCVTNGPGLSILEPQRAAETLTEGLDAILREIPGSEGGAR